jgi:hypothetical protein
VQSRPHARIVDLARDRAQVVVSPFRLHDCGTAFFDVTIVHVMLFLPKKARTASVSAVDKNP